MKFELGKLQKENESVKVEIAKLKSPHRIEEIALNDARKATSLFLNPDLNVPIMGVVENMSWFTPKQHPDEKYFIFTYFFI